MLTNVPVTIVLFEFDRSSPDMMYRSVGLVVEMIDCDYGEYDRIMQERIGPLQREGRNVQVIVFRRFPELPPSLIPKKTGSENS